MADPTTLSIIAAIAGSYMFRESVNRLLGPTMDYFGAELQDFAEFKMINLRGIAASAVAKTTPEALQQPGAVNPRVFKDVIEDGSLCSDPISTDYFGGILASSRSPDGRDDSAVPFTSLIKQLSSDQLLGHWILYSCLFLHLRGNSQINVYRRDGRGAARIFIPWYVFHFLFHNMFRSQSTALPYKFESRNEGHRAIFKVEPNVADKLRDHMPLAPNINIHVDPEVLRLESGNAETTLDTVRQWIPPGLTESSLMLRRLDVVFHGLLRHELADKMFWGAADYLTGVFSEVNAHGVVFIPSVFGIDLFLRAQGRSAERILTTCFTDFGFSYEPASFDTDVRNTIKTIHGAPMRDGGPA